MKSQVVTEIFDKAEMLNVSALYSEALILGFSDLGSSYRSPNWSNSCSEIYELMKVEHQVYAEDEYLKDLWDSLDDHSAILYFGGIQSAEGGKRQISVSDYFELLAQSLDKLSVQARQDLNKLCGTLVMSMRTILSVELYGKEN